MHRAYQIIEAVAEIHRDARTIAGERVDIGRMFTLGLVDMPFISVEIDEDAPLSDVGATDTSFIDSMLTVAVDFYAARSMKPVSTLMELREQSHKALMADDVLGLPSFVRNVIYAGADPVLKDPEGNKPLVMLRTYWKVHYQMNYRDPT